MSDTRHSDGTDGASTAADTHRESTAERTKTVADIRDTYADCADRMHRMEWLDRLLTGRYRRERFGDVRGRVLDVACGTGTNVRYLPESVDLVGIDVSPAMLEKARDRLEASTLEGTLERMDAANLAFADDSFDAVISAMSTCTFPDPVAALREMDRVCRPSGTIRLVEHGRSSVGPIARFQEWRADAHYEQYGCRWTQEPTAVVESAGLTVRDTTVGRLGMITTFEVEPS